MKLTFFIFLFLTLNASATTVTLYVSNCSSNSSNTDFYNDGASTNPDPQKGTQVSSAFKTLEGALKRLRDQSWGVNSINTYSTLNTSNYLVQDYIFEANQPIRIVLVNNSTCSSNEILVNDRTSYHMVHSIAFWGLTWNVTGTASNPITFEPADASKPTTQLISS
jgi:hypothetical protein